MAYGNTYRPDRLFLPQQRLLSFAAQIPTPFYLYDEDGIRKSARTVQGSFCWNPKHRPYFPMMANRCPAVLRLLREEGFGVLAQNVEELELAGICGFSGERILLHTPAMCDSVVAVAKRIGCGVIFDAPGQIDKFLDALPKRCLLRYHPDKVSPGSGFTTNTDRHKSGMSLEQIFEAAARLSQLGVKELGLHCHLASNTQQEGYYPAAGGVLFALCEELAERGIPISCCDLGGGIGLNNAPCELQLNLPRIGARLREKYRMYFPLNTGPSLYTELGRFVLGRHGLLLSRVVEVRERSRRYVILDASIANLPRLTLNIGQQKISVVGNCARENRLVYSVHGCTLDSRDRFNNRVMLPPVKPGDLLALHIAGAYAESMQQNLCMLPECASYLYTTDGRILPGNGSMQYKL